jgi:hypothetical protein
MPSVVAEIEWETGVHKVVGFAAVGSVVGRSVPRCWMWRVVKRKIGRVSVGVVVQLR